MLTLCRNCGAKVESFPELRKYFAENFSKFPKLFCNKLKIKVVKNDDRQKVSQKLRRGLKCALTFWA